MKSLKSNYEGTLTISEHNKRHAENDLHQKLHKFDEVESYLRNEVTGLINITLKKASKKEIEGTAYMNIGTQNVPNQSKTSAQDFNQGFSVNGTKGVISYFTSLNSTETKGISEAAGANFETDYFSRVNAFSF